MGPQIWFVILKFLLKDLGQELQSTIVILFERLVPNHGIMDIVQPAPEDIHPASEDINSALKGSLQTMLDHTGF